MNNLQNLYKKYDVPVPRYTSYPTVPFWDDSLSTNKWLDELNLFFNKSETSWSIYIHIPLCENLCTYCGCNTSVTKNHDMEEVYIDLVLKEFELYKKNITNLPNRPLKGIHLGGGSPTFLSPTNMNKLLYPILSYIKKDNKNFEASIEADPRTTKKEHIEVLNELGFNRLSLGVQDFNLEVQKAVNRIQPLELVEDVTTIARNQKWPINFDLIYGLPKQNLSLMKNNIETTLKIKPDRIAFYSMALVPWMKPSQKLINENELPTGEEKRKLYDYARNEFLKFGYIEIGMDHFALPHDNLAKAKLNKTLHRNFMGYSDIRTEILLGLGSSAISETPSCFHQNEKLIPKYQSKINQNNIPLMRGHVLSDEDKLYREKILKLMTTFEANLDNSDQLNEAKTYLDSMIQDNLVKIENNKLKITETGIPFLRNICTVFDQRMKQKNKNKNIFSKSI